MGFPEGVQTVVLTGHVGLADGQSQRDKITVTPSPPEVVSTTANFIMDDAPIEIVPDRSTGQFWIRLLAVDSTGINPTGWTYTVARGSRTPYSISLPAAVPTVDLADLTPVSADPGVYQLLAPVAAIEAYADTGDAGTLAAAYAYTDAHAGGSSPWRFNIEDHGAVADVQVLTDGATQAGVAHVVCATSQPFTTADVGKICIIPGAGLSGVTSFASRIASVPNASTAVFDDVCTQALTGATVIVGSNSYAAANAAVDAAEQYLNGTGTGAAAKPHTYAQVYTPPNAYIIHGPLQTTKYGNGQVIFGAYDPTKQKPGIAFEGESPVAAGVRHWQQLLPQGGGSCWISSFIYPSTSASNTDQDPAHNGIAGVISGPNEGTANGIAYGSVINNVATYSNITAVIRNMSILTAHSSLGLSIGAANLFGCANMIVENVSESTLGIVPGTDYVSPPSFSAGFSVGLVGPSPGNNDLSYVRNLSLQGGHTFGAWFSEHTLVDRVMCLYTWAAIGIVGSYGGSVGASHAVKILQASVESCTHELYFIGQGAQGITMVDIDQLQTEDGHPNISGNSAPALAAAVGRVKWTGLFTADNVQAQLTDGTPTPCGIEQVNGQVPRAISRITANRAATPLDRTIIIDPAAGAVTVTLPDAGFNAVEYVVKNLSASAATVAGNGTQLIYASSGTGATTAALATGQTLRLQGAYTGSAWAWYAV
jgi:hypothetical protein